MTESAVRMRMPGPTAAIWAGGVAALLGMVVYSHATTSPYPTSWPWITFAAMAILEEAVFTRASDGASPATRVVLLATVIMFRKHPDVIAVVTAVATMAGGFLARLPWQAVVTRSSWLLILAAGGTASLRLVGYDDTAHFVAATSVLILLYLGSTVVITRRRTQLPGGLVAASLGALVALAWRTPATGPFMLRLGQVAILALIGVTIGFAMGGRPQELLQRRLHLRGAPVMAIIGGLALVLSTRTSGQLSTLIALAGIGLIGIHAVLNRWFPVACLVLGAAGNEVARLANDGRMPVETLSLPASVVDQLGNLTETSTYQAANSGTHLAWLADRFPLTPFPGVASLGDCVIAVGIIWLFLTLAAPRREPAATERGVGGIAA